MEKGDTSLLSAVLDDEKSICISWIMIRFDSAWRCGVLRRERDIRTRPAATKTQKNLLIESIDTHMTTTS